MPDSTPDNEASELERRILNIYKWLAFNSSRIAYSVRPDGKGVLNTIDPKGDYYEKVDTSGFVIQHLSWSNNGFLAYEKSDDNSGRFETTVIMKPDSRIGIAHARHPVISPGGNYLLADRQGSITVFNDQGKFIANVNTTSSPQDYFWYSSTDIVTVSKEVAGQNGTMRLYRLNGSNIEQLSEQDLMDDISKGHRKYGMVQVISTCCNPGGWLAYSIERKKFIDIVYREKPHNDSYADVLLGDLVKALHDKLGDWRYGNEHIGNEIYETRSDICLYNPITGETRQIAELDGTVHKLLMTPDNSALLAVYYPKYSYLKWIRRSRKYESPTDFMTHTSNSEIRPVLLKIEISSGKYHDLNMGQGWNPRSLTLAPDGQKLAFFKDEALVIRDIMSGEERIIDEEKKGNFVDGIAWSPYLK